MKHAAWQTRAHGPLARTSRGWLATALLLLAVSAAAEPLVPSERERHTTECVAALEVSTEELAAQVRAGKEELRPLLLDRLRYGAAFIGRAYMNGDRDEDRSKALLDAALAAQKELPEADLHTRQLACADEGKRLLASANVIERAVVSRLASRRMKKLLGG